jgi:serine O-acetyltransferase
MINNKKDYKEYYIQDLKSTGIFENRWNLVHRIKDRRFKFYKSLRKAEYFTNCKNKGLNKFIAKLLRLKHSLLCDKYNWTIPINVFDKGLSIIHVGTIVVNGTAKIGQNCRIHVCVNIGNAIAKGKDGSPVIGDNVYIGPGAKIFGDIKIGDNVAIGANSVVNSSFESNCTIAGVPARKISDKTSIQYINVIKDQNG